MPQWIYLLIGIIAGAFVATTIVIFYYRKGFSETQKSIESKIKESDERDEQSRRFAEETRAKADEIISEAELKGENRRKELLLLCRDEVAKAKEEFENSVKDKKQELHSEKLRLDKRESSLDNKHNTYDQKIEELKKREKKLDDKVKTLEEREKKLEHFEDEKKAELEKIASMTRSEAEEIIMEEARKECLHDKAVLVRRLVDEAEETAEREAREIVVSTIQRYAADFVSDNTVYVVNLENDDMKGRIIGREGRNIRTFEKITGVQVLLDDTPQAVVLSAFNPIAREIGRLVMTKLIFDGRIHPSRIEETYRKVKSEFDKSLKEIGENAAMELNVQGLPQEVIKMLGRLKFRTSYGQNVLQHSMEVARLSGIMAAQLGLDESLAVRAGLLHDIGKANDFEESTSGTHVSLGAALARKYKMHDVITNTIESHHGDVEPKYLISALVAAADAISASRPGARQGEDVEKYIQRIEAMEKIAGETEGVEKAYALQAGREIRVLVSPEKVSDDEMLLIAREISKTIEDTMSYPGQIKVQVIREKRHIEMAE